MGLFFGEELKRNLLLTRLGLDRWLAIERIDEEGAG